MQMTAAPPDRDIASDEELAVSAAKGDRAALGLIYDRYADRLHDLCVGMVRDREAGADCVQEVFCTAAEKLPQLREPGRLRPWLYAIARNEALNVSGGHRREDGSGDLPDEESVEAGPATLAGRSELASLVAQAARGLSKRDCEVLELIYRHGLDDAELPEALDITPSNAAKIASRMRETVERALGPLLVARRVRRNPKACTGLSASLADWDGDFNVLMRKRIARHIDACDTCERTRRDAVNPKALLGLAPILAAPWWLRGQTLAKAQLTSAEGAEDSVIAWSDEETRFGAPTETLDRQPADTLGSQTTDSYLEDSESESEPGPDDGADADDGLRRRWIGPIAVLVGVLLVVVAGGVYLWLHRHNLPFAPQTVIKTPQSTSAPSGPAPSSAPPPAQTAPSSPPTSAPPPSSPPTSEAPPPPSQTVSPSYQPTYTPTYTQTYTPTRRAPATSAPSEQPSASASPTAPPGWPPGLPTLAPWTPPTFQLPTLPGMPGNTPAPGR
jgi:RNA polymerase sigma factor (sigma-70 family)